MTFRPPVVSRITQVDRQASLVTALGTALCIVASVVNVLPVGQRGAQDWPVPKAAQPSIVLRTHLDPLKLTLRGQDKFFGSAGMGPVYDWPNPRGAVGSISLRTYTDPLKLTLLGKDQFFGGAGQPAPNRDWPNPIARPRYPVGDQLGYIDPTEFWMLGGVAAPFAQRDWLVPKGAQQLSVRPLPSNRLFTIGTPFGQSDWQNPIARSRYPTGDQLGYIDPSEVWLFSGVIAPFTQDDWPNPLARSRAMVGDQLGYIDPSEYWMLNSLVPNAQGDWSNPRGAKGLVGDQLGYIDPTEYWLLGVPFNQGDWLNPRGNIRIIDGQYGAAFALINGTIVAPFAQGDWPTPKGYSASVDLRTFVSSLKLNLIGQDAFFGAPGVGPTYDWPLPVRKPTSTITWIDAYPNRVIALAGFNQTDWPVPKGYSASIELRTFTSPLKLNLIGQDQFFGAAGQGPVYDWPLPGRKITSTITWIDAYPNRVVALAGFNQTDWPNPRGASAAISLRTHIDPLKLAIYGQDVFFGAAGQGPAYEMPVPRGPARNASQLGFTDYYPNKNIAVAGFNQFDWPVPKGARSLIGDQLGHLRSTEFWMLNSTIPVAQLDWPLPRGPRNLVSGQFGQFGYIDPSEFWLFTGPAPFAQLDWTNPLRGTPSPSIYGHVNQYRVALFGTVTPFYQMDWANPVGRASTVGNFGWVDAYKVNLFAVPFAQRDWPVPSTIKTAIDLKTFTRSIAYQLIGKDKFFGPPGLGPTYDWPNPRGAARNVGTFGLARSLNLLLTFVQSGKFARHVIGQAVQAFITGRPSSTTVTIIGRPETATIVGTTIMTVHDPLTFVCGDSWELTGPLQDANGAPLNLSGATITWKLDATDVNGVVTNALTLSLGAGISILSLPTATIFVEASAAQSATIPPGTYTDWLRVTLASGDVFTEWTGVIRATANPT